VLSEAGRNAAPSAEPLPRGDALLHFWCERVGVMGGTMLPIVVAHYPNEVSADSLAELTGYRKSGSFSGALAVLRTLDLITKRGIRASDELIEGMRI
jgi:hypothetical protein